VTNKGSSAVGCGDDGGGTSPANHRPVLAAQADTTVAVGDSLELWAWAEDVDGDALTYSLAIRMTLTELKQGHLPDTHFDAQTGHFVFRPSPDDRPSRFFEFRVSDGRGGADSTSFTVTVD
jgi:hypothetical protein